MGAEWATEWEARLLDGTFKRAAESSHLARFLILCPTMNRTSPLTICLLSLSFLVSCKPTEDGFDPSAPTTLSPDEPSSCKEAIQEGGVQRLDRWVLSESCKKADFDADAALSQAARRRGHGGR